MNSVNPEMVRLARESLELTQQDLADRAGVQQGTISKVENGLIELEPERVDALARALGCPIELLQVEEQPEAVLALFNRKLKTTPIGSVRAAQARVNLTRLQLSRMLQGVEVEHTYRFPRLDLDELDGDVERAAQIVRRTWRQPTGPIRSLTALVEAAGGVVTELDFGSVKIDAAAQWPVGDRPFFFMRPGLTGDRYRFNLAHEIGHMVLHDVPDPALEDQAHHFAGALLVPADELRPQIPMKLNLGTLLELKLHWGVSMAMLVMRGSQIGAITERQKRSFFQMVNARGMRSREPGRIPLENPTVVTNVVEAYLHGMGYTPAELSRVALLNEGEFRRRYMPPAGLRVVS